MGKVIKFPTKEELKKKKSNKERKKAIERLIKYAESLGW